MGEENHGLNRWFYSFWLRAVTPAVRLSFGIRRALGWRRASGRQRFMVTVGALCALSVVAGVLLAVAGVGKPGPPVPGLGRTAAQTATANRARAAAWIAGQVGPDVTVSCDPEMCGEVRKSGFPAARLRTLPGTAGRPLGSGLVVATPAVRDQFGARLATVYAPLVIAGFGAGADRVDVRAVAPDGAAAFRSQLVAEHTALISAGKQLLSNKGIQASPSARAVLLAGHADPRLLATLAALASQLPLRLVAFDDLSPGADTAVLLRGAEIGTATAALSRTLAFLHAQQGPYLPAVSGITRNASGQSLLTVWFDAQGLTGAAGF